MEELWVRLNTDFLANEVFLIISKYLISWQFISNDSLFKAPCLSLSPWDTITKYHQMGDLARQFFLTVMGLVKNQSADWISSFWWPLLGLQMASSCCKSQGRDRKSSLVSFLVKTIISSWGPHLVDLTQFQLPPKCPMSR